MRLTTALAGADPMQSIASRVSDYWVRRLQRAFVAGAQGVFATNELSTPNLGRTGTGLNAAYGVQGDLTNDISATAYSAGVTDFNAESFIDTCTLLGDAAEDVTAVFMHSIVYAKAQKNNLIDFIPDAEGHVNIPAFLGRRASSLTTVCRTRLATSTNGSQDRPRESITLGSSARHRLRLGVGTPVVPTEVFRYPSRGNGAGSDVLFNRVEWCIHPVGHAWIGSSPAYEGGPTSNAQLSQSGSFVRVFPERASKSAGSACLITRESLGNPGRMARRLIRYRGWLRPALLYLLFWFYISCAGATSLSDSTRRVSPRDSLSKADLFSFRPSTLKEGVVRCLITRTRLSILKGA